MKRDTHQAGLDYLDYVHREIMLPYTILRLEKNDRAKQGCENETDPYERVHGELFDRLDTLLAAMQPEVDALLLEVINEETEPAAKRSALKKIRQHWHTRTTRHRA